MPREEEQQIKVAGMPKDVDLVKQTIDVFAVHGGFLSGSQTRDQCYRPPSSETTRLFPVRTCLRHALRRGRTTANESQFARSAMVSKRTYLRRKIDEGQPPPSQLDENLVYGLRRSPEQEHDLVESCVRVVQE